MSETENVELLRTMARAAEIMRKSSDDEIEETSRAWLEARAAVLARMSPGWRPIELGQEHAINGEVLLRGYYPEGRGVSDIYHGWWDGERWTRWPHPFPPTHYTPIQPLPAPPFQDA